MPEAPAPTRHFALSALGRDRPGIVAGVTERLLAHGVNVEDSRMAILRGHFAMVLVLSAPEDVDAAALAADLDAVGERLELEAVLLREVPGLESEAAPAPSHVVTVYGADHPGIVHAVTAALAELEVNVADLQTRLVGEEERPLYVMVLEVVCPPGVEAARVQEALQPAATAQGVDVSVRALERDAL